jgi:methylenetetrahydrofolate reductase (NADPH)
MQVSCRDRNRIAIQGDVLGAAAIGVASVLCLTGDGVESGDHPQAKPVFDIESITLLSMLRKMRDESQFESGRKITGAPRLFLGAAANPFVPPFDFRPLRLAKKIEAGAQFIQTQYCFDIERFRQFMSSVRDLGLHEKAFILVGVGPLASARAAEWIRKNVPGVHIPDAIVERLAKSRNQREEGKRICVEIMQQVRDIEGVSGVHVMAYRQEELIAEIIQQSGVLGHRTPWNPSQAQPSER